MHLTLAQMKPHRYGMYVRFPINAMFDMPPILDWLHELKSGEFAEKTPGEPWLIWGREC